jgi:hypothetical protein
MDPTADEYRCYNICITENLHWRPPERGLLIRCPFQGPRTNFGQKDQALTASSESWSLMNARISSALSSSFSHWDLYNVTGKRPMP